MAQTVTQCLDGGIEGGNGLADTCGRHSEKPLSVTNRAVAFFYQLPLSPTHLTVWEFHFPKGAARRGGAVYFKSCVTLDRRKICEKRSLKQGGGEYLGCLLEISVFVGDGRNARHAFEIKPAACQIAQTNQPRSVGIELGGGSVRSRRYQIDCAILCVFLHQLRHARDLVTYVAEGDLGRQGDHIREKRGTGGDFLSDLFGYRGLHKA